MPAAFECYKASPGNIVHAEALPHAKFPATLAPNSGSGGMEFGYFTLSDNAYPDNPRSPEDFVM